MIFVLVLIASSFAIPIVFGERILVVAVVPAFAAASKWFESVVVEMGGCCVVDYVAMKFVPVNEQFVRSVSELVLLAMTFVVVVGLKNNCWCCCHGLNYYGMGLNSIQNHY